MTNEPDRKIKPWEQHGQTILLFVITGVLAFASKTLWDSNAVQAQMTERLQSLSQQVSRLEGAVSTMNSQYVTRAEFSVHEQRLQSVEARRK